MVKLLRYIVFILGIVTVLITVIFIISIWENFDLVGTGKISWENTSQISDFFGGVVGTLLSAMGFILIYLSFNSQTETQIDQKNQFLESQIENRFIELIKIHKETVKDLEYEGLEKLNGQKVIDFIVNQFEACFKEIEPFFKEINPNNLYKTEILSGIKEMAILRSLNLIQLAKIDIAYSIVFFGTSKDDLKSLNRLLKQQYNEILIDNVLSFIKLKSSKTENLEKWEIIQKKDLSSQQISTILNKYKQDRTVNKTQFDSDYQDAFEFLLNKSQTDKYYGGHQYKLGHYFRHLFLTVKYINEQKIIDYKKKYNYVKMLRAQISTIEQYLIFYNSLSFMGRAWELEHINSTPSNDQKNSWLFTKYNFVKNIPDLTQPTGLVLNDYYPDLHFEFETKPTTRIKLEKIFF